jgi:hypothetical protein
MQLTNNSHSQVLEIIEEKFFKKGLANGRKK